MVVHSFFFNLATKVYNEVWFIISQGQPPKINKIFLTAKKKIQRYPVELKKGMEKDQKQKENLVNLKYELKCKK